MRRVGYVVVVLMIVLLQLETLDQLFRTNEQLDQLNERVNTLEQIVVYKTNPVQFTEKDRQCLARNMYYEAGNQTEHGQIAVAQVTVNRLRDGRWGKHVCDVVYSKAQFSWTLDKKKRWAQPRGPLWENVKATLVKFEKGTRIKGLESSLTYHADYIAKPFWARVQEPVKRIGAHIFYKSVDKPKAVKV